MMTISIDKFSSLNITEQSDRVIARMSKPSTRNAIDSTMVNEFHLLCSELEETPKLLIITGCEANGRQIFASGADIAQLRARRRDDALRGINNSVFNRIAHLPLPVIAAVDGYALGGGLELALAADFRISTAKAKFGQPEAGLGIIAAAGALWRLKACVGEPLAKEILLAGKTLTGEEALKAGLVTELSTSEDLLAAANAYADRIAKLDPLAVQISKKLMDMPLSAHPSVDNIAQAILFESEAKFDRMQAFLDQRKDKK